MTAMTANDRLSHHFAAMAYNNAWANFRLLSVTAQLPDEEMLAPRTGFFPSLAATLNHNLVVDRFYVDALEHAFAGEPPSPSARSVFENRTPCPAGPDLLVAQQIVDRRLVALCVALTDARIDTPVGLLRSSGAVAYESASRVLPHLFQHQIHHRGQAHAMLSGTRLAPPQLDDFFFASDADVRRADFASLGFTEDAIWLTRSRAP